MATFTKVYVANSGFEAQSVYVFCGLATIASEQNTYSTLEHTQDNTWISRTASPTPAGNTGREVPGAASIGLKGYLYGGGDDTTSLTRTDEYTRPSTWTAKSAMPSPARRKGASCSIGGVAFMFGGSGAPDDDLIYDDSDAYTQGTNTWAGILDLPTARYRTTGVTIASKAYIMGGYTDPAGTVLLADNDEYSAGAYTSKAPIAVGDRAEHGAAVVASKAYVIGGFSTTSPSTAYYRNEEYNPTGDAWTTKTAMPPPGRAEMPCAAMHGFVYAMGGKRPDEGSRPTRTTMQYSPTGNSYALRADFVDNAQRRNHSGMAI